MPVKLPSKKNVRQLYSNFLGSFDRKLAQVFQTIILPLFLDHVSKGLVSLG